MLRSEKKYALTLLETVSDALVHSAQSGNLQVIADCIRALESLHASLEKSGETLAGNAYALLSYIKDTLYAAPAHDAYVQAQTILVSFYEKLRAAPCKIKMLFLPYIAKMWTALESIWYAASQDAGCITDVVPIPYHKLELAPGGRVLERELVYEGTHYPSYVPIRYYEQYDIDQERPDAIFIHNPYDNTNNLTRIPQKYYSSELASKSDCLVYSSYGILGFSSVDARNQHMDFPAYQNVDFVISPSEKYNRSFTEYGYPKEKFLTLGCPKIDHIVKPILPPVIPEEWREKAKNKTVFLLNTHFTMVLSTRQNPHTGQQEFPTYNVQKRIIKHILDNPDYVLLWRPHPLLENMLESRHALELLKDVRALKKEVAQATNGILDDTPDYLPAFYLSSALFTAHSSLVYEYIATGKPIFLMHGATHCLPKILRIYRAAAVNVEHCYSYDDFQYLYTKRTGKYTDFEIIHSLPAIVAFMEMVAQDKDPLKEARMADCREAYLNSEDGSCGQKVYETLKSALLQF